MMTQQIMQKLDFLPQKFLQRLQQIVPEIFLENCLTAFLHERRTSIRINTLKVLTNTLLHDLQKQGLELQPLAWHNEIFSIPNEQRRKLTETSAFQQSLFYIQNPSSVVPVLLLDPKPGEEILDLAAAPGGKTINIAIQMRNKGKIAAVEAVKSRFFRLTQNLQNYGVTIAKTFLKDGSLVYRVCPERFDRVLLDAPCSSESRFNYHDPESYAYWSERKIAEMTRKQKKLLYSAFQSLKPGGVLVYSTCSFAPEENEMMIQHIYEKFPNSIAIEKVDVSFLNYQQGLTQWQNKIFWQDIKNAIRILPNDIMDAFFICKIRKLASTQK